MRSLYCPLACDGASTDVTARRLLVPRVSSAALASGRGMPGTRSGQTGGGAPGGDRATGGGATGGGGAAGGGAVALEEAAAAKPPAAKVAAARLSSELRLLREANEVAPGQRLAWGGEAPELGDAEAEVTDLDCALSAKPSSNLRPRAALSAARERGRAANAPSASASASTAPRASDSSLSAARKRPRSTPPRAEPAADTEAEAAYVARVQASARKRRKPAERCLRSDKCSMPAGHAGWCDKRCGGSAAAGKALGQGPDGPDESDEDEAVATEPVADVVARVQAAARERRPPLPLAPADPRPDMVLARQLFGFLKPRYATSLGLEP